MRHVLEGHQKYDAAEHYKATNSITRPATFHAANTNHPSHLYHPPFSPSLEPSSYALCHMSVHAAVRQQA